MTIDIVAEAAQGHQGGRVRQETLIDYAVAAGADAVKFQLAYADELSTPDYRYYEAFRESEMPDAAWSAAADRAHASGIALYLDVFGPRGVAVAVEAGADGLKIHSTDTVNVGLLESVAGSPIERVLLSVGGALKSEITDAVEALGSKRIALVHGFQGYPTPNEHNQLRRIAWLVAAFPHCTVGFADHVPFDDPARLWLAAVAIGAGAQLVEKHITDTLVTRPRDHEAALNPDEFQLFVRNMRLAAAAAGADATTSDEDFGMSSTESAYRSAMRKQVVAARDIDAGECIAAGDVVLKRSGASGTALSDLSIVLGRTLLERVPRHAPIREHQLG
jgi:N,N'-diacetyllegionaminate synthase